MSQKDGELARAIQPIHSCLQHSEVLAYMHGTLAKQYRICFVVLCFTYLPCLTKTSSTDSFVSIQEIPKTTVSFLKN